MFTKITAAAAVILAASAMSASAEAGPRTAEAPAASAASETHAAPAERRISRDDFMARAAARAEAAFERMDADGDGYLTREEMRGAAMRGHERMKRDGPRWTRGPAKEGGKDRPAPSGD